MAKVVNNNLEHKHSEFYHKLIFVLIFRPERRRYFHRIHLNLFNTASSEALQEGKPIMGFDITEYLGSSENLKPWSYTTGLWNPEVILQSYDNMCVCKLYTYKTQFDHMYRIIPNKRSCPIIKRQPVFFIDSEAQPLHLRWDNYLLFL